MTETLVMMLDEMPAVMRQDELLNELFKSVDIALAKRDIKIEVVFNERFVDHATDSGLKYLEIRLGIITDQTKSLDHRRSLIKARLKGKGKINLSKVDDICESWINGQVDTSISGSTINVKFVSVGGIPEGVSDLEKTLLDIIPSHLKINWQYTFMTWDMFESYNWPFDEFETQNLSWDELEVLVS
ncbi:DUF2313 domain-containing protein [Acidaminobacter sp. JC074]|uniref:putative phage tail protein n=1 Tax=Acidaminobacter sp. JC074 TaxID=2530199 RepID=UPI001F104310|nr:putative phage tail protein [Acidaminobacter sp. JC074]MCH4891172.1 DUF2313 domain-containing protein [Acidaminobacter sp. JC074]